jgi:dTDP-4-amino-4,6-dideoxygalactose transaminase
MIPFNKPYYSGEEKDAMSGPVPADIIEKCESALEKKYGFNKVFLTNSCTIALEMAAILANIKPGDEVIMPSFTYVSTANAFALRGAKIIFADSRDDHPNMDESQLEKLITGRTKVIVVVHYAGNACDMDAVRTIADKHDLLIVEDAAQCIDAFYKKKPLGSIGDIACFSFHETKNIHCGEGGFMVINDPKLMARAEVIRNKGTNRSSFMRAEVNKYQWVDLGFSSMPSRITAALLYHQLEKIENVQKKRSILWDHYFLKLKDLELYNVGLPILEDYTSNNAHIFYFICKSLSEREALIGYLEKKGIHAVFHYQALHQSEFYLSQNKEILLPNAEKYSNCLLRLPLFYDLALQEADQICDAILDFYANKKPD